MIEAKIAVFRITGEPEELNILIGDDMDDLQPVGLMKTIEKAGKYTDIKTHEGHYIRAEETFHEFYFFESTPRDLGLE